LESPIISIIIPTYNRAALLPETIQSILSQNYASWELLMIDDGSDEATRNLLFSYEKKMHA